MEIRKLVQISCISKISAPLIWFLDVVEDCNLSSDVRFMNMTKNVTKNILINPIIEFFVKGLSNVNLEDFE